jgi:4-hydroxybenzoate polyprenyltransferase
LSASQERRYRIHLLKLIALLSKVRWYNVILLVTAQYLASFLIMRPPENWYYSITDFRLHLIIMSSALVIAAGFLINSFYDQEKDLINRPQQTLFERMVSSNTTLQLFFLFNVTAIALAYIVSWRAAFFYGSYALALWFYSHKLKRLTFLGNLTAAILAITPFFGILFYFNETRWDLFFYVSFMLFVELCREIVKDILALKGDIIIGYRTLPAVIGMRKTKTVILLINVLSFVPAFLLYDIFSLPVLIFLVSCLTGVTIVNLFLMLDDQESRTMKALAWYKVFIIGSVLSLALFSS